MLYFQFYVLKRNVDKQVQHPYVLLVFKVLGRNRKARRRYWLHILCNLESEQVQNSLYILCCFVIAWANKWEIAYIYCFLLQFGGLKSWKKHIFTVIFAIQRANKCKIANTHLYLKSLAGIARRKEGSLRRVNMLIFHCTESETTFREAGHVDISLCSGERRC